MGPLRALSADSREFAAPGSASRSTEVGTDGLSALRAAGNRAVARALNRRTGLQAKLEVDAENDPHEAEADRVADAVVRSMHAGRGPGVPRGLASRPPALSRAPVAPPGLAAPAGTVPRAVESAISSLNGRGASLPAGIRAPTEQALGVDLGHVRVHTDQRAHELTSGMGARAFTVGSDIYFKRGQFGSGERGSHLLAHELSHVVQQGGGSTGFSGPGVSASTGGRAQLAIDDEEDKDDEIPPYATTILVEEGNDEGPPEYSDILQEEAPNEEPVEYSDILQDQAPNEEPIEYANIIQEETKNDLPPAYGNIPQTQQLNQGANEVSPYNNVEEPAPQPGSPAGGRGLWSRLKGAMGSAVSRVGAGIRSLAGRVKGLFGGSGRGAPSTGPAPNKASPGRPQSFMYFAEEGTAPNQAVQVPDEAQQNVMGNMGGRQSDEAPKDYADMVVGDTGAVQIISPNQAGSQAPVQAPVRPTRGVPVPNLAPGTKYGKMKQRGINYAEEFKQGSTDLFAIVRNSLRDGDDEARISEILRTHFGWKQEDCDRHVANVERHVLRKTAEDYVGANLAVDQIETEFTQAGLWNGYRPWTEAGINRYKDQIKKNVEDIQAQLPDDTALPGVQEVQGGEEREKLELHGGNPLTQGAGTEPYSTAGSFSKFMGQGWSIFVMSGSGDLFAGQHKVGLFHHSSLLGGGDVAGAGEINVENGQVKKISNKSGHYKPGRDEAFQVLQEFAGRGVDLSQVVFCDASTGDPKRPENQFNAEEWYVKARDQAWGEM